MRFSIIIPAYNSENHIRKALDSIKSQTFKNYELIVICDSCTDNTKNIAEEYGAITREVNFNCDGPTRSAGLDIARGEFVLFMDDDDWWIHEYVLEQLDNKLREYPDVDILCFSFIFKGCGYAAPRGYMNGNHWPAVWNKCWRRSKIGNTRFPNVYAISDSFFHDEMMKKDLKIIDWDMPMYYYNFRRIGSITESGKGK